MPANLPTVFRHSEKLKIFLHRDLAPGLLDLRRMFVEHNPDNQYEFITSPEATAMLLGVASSESNMRKVKQINGVALGAYQIEPATHDDIWAWARTRSRHKEWLPTALNTWLRENARKFSSRQKTLNVALLNNTQYGSIMARLFFFRIPEPLPKYKCMGTQELRTSALEFAKYYKKHYNTEGGKADVEKVAEHMERAILVTEHAS